MSWRGLKRSRRIRTRKPGKLGGPGGRNPLGMAIGSAKEELPIFKLIVIAFYLFSDFDSCYVGSGSSDVIKTTHNLTQLF